MERKRNALLICSLVGVFLLAAASSGYCSSDIRMQYSGEELSLHSSRAPLLEVLKVFERQSGMQVYFSPRINPGHVDASFDLLPLDQAMRLVLSDYSFALIYKKEGEAWKPHRLEIYPEGKRSGQLKPLGDGDVAAAAAPDSEIKTVLVRSGGKVVLHGGTSRAGGVLAPSHAQVVDPADTEELASKPWFVFQKRAEAEEQKEYRELMLLKRKMKSAQGEKKEALSALYNKEMREYHERKIARQNKIESLKRLQDSRELARQQEGN